MTVSQLIEQLSKCDPDSEVIINLSEDEIGLAEYVELEPGPEARIIIVGDVW